MRRALSAAIAVAALALTPATAAAHTVTRTAGPVSATLSWQGQYEHTRKFRISIDRDGTTVFAHRVKATDCGDRIPDYACPYPFGNKSLDLRDLDGDGEPEAVVAGFTGGAHCCVVGIVYRWDGTTYARSDFDFLDPGYTLDDVNGDGRFEFVTYDARFRYLYGSYAESVFPIQVIAFGGGKFDDVTADFPELVSKDARRLGHEYRKRARGRHKFGVRTAIAAYIADLYRLGDKDKAKRKLQDALDAGLLDRQNAFETGPFGKHFVFDLLRTLRVFGYR